jgi:hypothetical protein
MSAVTPFFKVHCHKGGHVYVLYVQAADGNFETLKAVIVANNGVPGSGALQISAVQQVSPTASIA